LKRANVSLPATRSLDGKVVGARAQTAARRRNVRAMAPVFIAGETGELAEVDREHVA
jgi:hypothetical protein